MQPRHAVFEGLVELAQSPNHEVDEVVDVGIGLLLGVDGVDFPFGLLLPDSEKVINGVLEYFDDFLRYELFLG